jgi:hypothetical protein
MQGIGVATIVAMGLLGCAAVPPEREERDRAVLAAVEPCRQQYPEVFANMPMSVYPDGRVRYWYKGHAVAQSYDIDRCISEATKDLKLGPWAPGRLVRAGPASIPIRSFGGEVVAPVRVNGILGTMAVRTNSNLTYITAAYAKRVGLQIVPESPATRVRFGDTTLVIPYVRTRAVEVGDALVERLDVAVHELLPGKPEIDGVLGRSFLSHFNVTIDRTRNVLRLESILPTAGSAPGPASIDAPASPTSVAAVPREWRLPVWHVGDEWRMRWESPTGKGAYVQSMEGEETVEGVVHYVTKAGARRTYYIKDTLAWHFEKNTDGAVTLRRTPALTFAWPLAPGKSWHQQYERREGSKTEQISLACAVVAETRMTVPAGTYDTLHIRCDTPTRTAWEWWYAGEVKHWVRRRSVQNAGDRIDELLSYSGGLK